MSASEAALALFEQALNRYLRLDPDTSGRLGPLHGKIVQLRVSGLGLDLYLAPGPQGVQIFGEYDAEPDCILAGTPLALARLGRREDSADQLFKGEVEIRGDTETAHRFGDLLADIDIDWEEQLSRLTGDIAAHQIGSGVRSAGRWAGQVADTLPMDLQEYLQEESRLLPSRFEADEFAAGVDRLRDDTERLAARVRRLRRSGNDDDPA